LYADTFGKLSVLIPASPDRFIQPERGARSVRKANHGRSFFPMKRSLVDEVLFVRLHRFMMRYSASYVIYDAIYAFNNAFYDA